MTMFVTADNHRKGVTTSVFDTGGKFAAGVNGKFAACVNDACSAP
jgi:hypothetical protein